MLGVPVAGDGTPVAHVDPARIVAVVTDGKAGCALLLDGGWKITTTWTYSELCGALSSYPSTPA